MKNVLVTGATGFVGAAVVDRLTASSSFTPHAVVRQVHQHLPATVDTVHVPDLLSNTDWSVALLGVDTVVHSAAHVHVINGSSCDPSTEFFKVNTCGTMNLARQAAEAGAELFVFISSIKVNGEITAIGHPFCPEDKFVPTDPYGLSKYKAEQGLFELTAETKMKVVVIRPPLVYGPGVKANFLHLLRAIDCGIPLPLASINNARSFVGLANLVDFIITCLRHPTAAGETFLVADGKDFSTPELIRKIAQLMNRPSMLFPFPPKLLRFMARLLGKKAMIDRLCDPLQVDISKSKKLLGWQPPLSVDEELKKTVAWYMKEKAKGKKGNRR